MAALAPMPSANVTITTSASPGVRMREWYATLRSRTNGIFLPPNLARDICITSANIKRHILNHLVCDELVNALRFRTPLSQIRTLMEKEPISLAGQQQLPLKHLT